MSVGQLGMGFVVDTGGGGADRDLSQWDTRPETARELVRWAGVDSSDTVLEPSAGRGNVVAELVRVRARVIAVEIDGARVELMRRRFAGKADPSPIHHADFLDFSARMITTGNAFTVVVGNPPYENGLDLEFVLASLMFSPRVVFILRLAFLEGKERHERLWRHHHLAGLRVFSERERFEGDVDGSPKSPMAFFDIRRGSPEKSIVGWV